MFNKTFQALTNEAEFTKEILGSGATQIRRANYASKGIYFQAFTSLSTGFERIGKLCLMLDYYIENNGNFPDLQYMKKVIGHDIVLIYNKSLEVIKKRALLLKFLPDLDGGIYRAILKILSEFAKGDRYSNIDLLVAGSLRQNDSIASWFNNVDAPLFNIHVSKRKKETISRNANITAKIASSFTSVLYTSETRSVITNLEEASKRTDMWKAVAPYRQLYVIQIIRYWVELLCFLQDMAMEATGEDDIPFFSEIFGSYRNPDSYIRTRKTWDAI